MERLDGFGALAPLFDGGAVVLAVEIGSLMCTPGSEVGVGGLDILRDGAAVVGWR